LAAVSSNGLALGHAAEILKVNRKIVLAARSKVGCACDMQLQL